MSNCNNGNNNQYLNYPPIMNDSRYITDFNSIIINDNKIKSNNNIQNNTESHNECRYDLSRGHYNLARYILYNI